MKHLMIAALQLIGCISLTAQSIEDISFGTETTLDIVTWNIERFPKNGQTTIDYVIEIIDANTAATNESFEYVYEYNDANLPVSRTRRFDIPTFYEY